MKQPYDLWVTTRSIGGSVYMMLCIIGCCILVSSCSTQQQKPASVEELRNLTQQLGRINPIDRSTHRNPQVIEILNAQNTVAAAFVKAKTTGERDAEIQLYGRFSRQLQLHQLIIQQRPSPGPPRQSKISNGRPAASGQIPYQAALISTGYSSPLYGQYCGATVIDPYWVLTAGHCVG